MIEYTFALRHPRVLLLLERFSPAEQARAKTLLQEYLTFSILLSVLPTLEQDRHRECIEVFATRNKEEIEKWVAAQESPLRLLIEQTTARALSALESAL